MNRQEIENLFVCSAIILCLFIGIYSDWSTLERKVSVYKCQVKLASIHVFTLQSLYCAFLVSQSQRFACVWARHRDGNYADVRSLHSGVCRTRWCTESTDGSNYKITLETLVGWNIIFLPQYRSLLVSVVFLLELFKPQYYFLVKVLLITFSKLCYNFEVWNMIFPRFYRHYLFLQFYV